MISTDHFHPKSHDQTYFYVLRVDYFFPDENTMCLELILKSEAQNRGGFFP